MDMTADVLELLQYPSILVNSSQLWLYLKTFFKNHRRLFWFDMSIRSQVSKKIISTKSNPQPIIEWEFYLNSLGPWFFWGITAKQKIYTFSKNFPPWLSSSHPQ